METKRPLAIVILGIVFILALVGNIYVHEAGHYIMADHLDLDPEMHMTPLVSSENPAYLISNEPIAYTEFYLSDTPVENAYVGFAGPLANMLIAGIIGLAYLAVPKNKRSFLVKMLFIMILIPTMFSIVVNLAPLAGTDGSFILSALA